MAAEKPGSPEIFQRPGMGREPAVTTVPGETESENNFQVFFLPWKDRTFFFSSQDFLQCKWKILMFRATPSLQDGRQRGVLTL